MKKFLLSAAVVAALVGVGAAQAADPIMPMEPVVPVVDNAYDWTGFYVGAFGGFGTGTSFDTGPVNVPLQGAMAGVDVGGNAQFGRFVLGAEGDIAWANIGGSV